MNQSQWTGVDAYFASLLLPPDETLDAALKASADAGLPAISVSPLQGRLLHLLALGARARRILEIGTLGGYSTIWMARTLPAGGRLVTLEAAPAYAEVARANIDRAGMGERVDIRVGRAQESLPRLVDEGAEPFDMVFIDADKESYPEYLEWSLRLTRPGSMIVADNVVRDGEVVDPATTDPLVRGVRRFNDLLAAEPRLRATAIQTVGVKGYDGFVLAVVLSR